MSQPPPQDWNFILLVMTALGAFGAFVVEGWYRIRSYLKERREQKRVQIAQLNRQLELYRDARTTVKLQTQKLLSLKFENGWRLWLTSELSVLERDVQEYNKVSRELYEWFKASEKIAKLLVGSSARAYLENTSQAYKQLGSGILVDHLAEVLVGSIIRGEMLGKGWLEQSNNILYEKMMKSQQPGESLVVFFNGLNDSIKKEGAFEMLKLKQQELLEKGEYLEKRIEELIGPLEVRLNALSD